MKLNDVLNSLREMKYVTDNTKIQVVLNKEKSIKTDDKVFECYIPVKQAEHFFGELDVSLNQIRKIGECEIPTFWFLLAYYEAK